jgi:hypothetical protein
MAVGALWKYALVDPFSTDLTVYAAIGCVAKIGELAPDFVAHILLTLSDLSGTPTALIFGCYTCPIFRRQSGRMRQLIASHDAAIQFIFVYVLEAHPTDGWKTPSNTAADIMYSQPVNMDERAKVANDWRSAYGFESPIVLDWPDNRINDDYDGSPERLYVLDSEGVVTFKSEQGPYNDDHLDDWAVALEQDDQSIKARELRCKYGGKCRFLTI